MARRLLLLAALLVVSYFTAILLVYRTIPHSDTGLQHFDTLIVLGSPTEPDGNPSPEQRERVLAGVAEYRRGRAAHIIMTGGAAHNRFVEAHAMILLAEANRVPASAMVEEGASAEHSPEHLLQQGRDGSARMAQR